MDKWLLDDMLFIKGLIANLLTKGQTVLDYLTLPQ